MAEPVLTPMRLADIMKSGGDGADARDELVGGSGSDEAARAAHEHMGSAWIFAHDRGPALDRGEIYAD